MWHVRSRSGVAALRTAIHLLLACLLTYSHQQRASHQTVHISFLANDRCLRDYDLVVAHWGALKTQVLENASMENASTKQRISQGWKTDVRITQVRICRNGKRKYGKCKYNANLQSDKKKFGTSQVSVVHFQVGWESGLQIVFSEIT